MNIFEKLLYLLSIRSEGSMHTIAYELVRNQGVWRNGIGEFSNSKLVVKNSGNGHLHIWKKIPGGNLVLVYEDDYFDRGFWLLDLWRAL